MARALIWYRRANGVRTAAEKKAAMEGTRESDAKEGDDAGAGDQEGEVLKDGRTEVAVDVERGGEDVEEKRPADPAKEGEANKRLTQQRSNADGKRPISVCDGNATRQERQGKQQRRGYNAPSSSTSGIEAVTLSDDDDAELSCLPNLVQQGPRHVSPREGKETDAGNKRERTDLEGRPRRITVPRINYDETKRREPVKRKAHEVNQQKTAKRRAVSGKTCSLKRAVEVGDVTIERIVGGRYEWRDAGYVEKRPIVYDDGG